MLTVTLACTAKGKTFSKIGMSVTLTTDFREKPKDNYDAYYEAKSANLFIIKEEFSDFVAAGYDPNDISLKDYASLVANASGLDVKVTESEGLTVFEFNETTKGTEFYHLAVFYKGTTAFWTFEFACAEKNTKKMTPSFLKWAKSVKVE